MAGTSELKDLYEKDPYGDATVAKLEAYAKEELAGSSVYDFEANKALVKYYQCFPDKTNVDMLLGVLMMALMHLPATDFLALSCIAPGTAAQSMTAIQELADALTSGRFGPFWGSMGAIKGKAYMPKDFEAKVRAYILTSVQRTFTNISRAQVETMLGLSGGDLEKLLSASAVVRESKPDIIVFSPCTENQKSGAKFDETLSFDDVLKVMKTLAE